MIKKKYEVAWVLFDGTFDHVGTFDTMEEAEEFMNKFPKSDFVWREVDWTVYDN
ncbi:hypothetical protein PHIN3_159 [Sinorhizobium phage phiN3]|uniref:Uncharacterized protein n=1 Tax=Sinorhizobium phage phiN3 TaxID=1647405 RepID=A0A0F6YPD5_9CAUD|nr:hypothetical protein AVT40_gp374 [Sinorhizobium phage phiN3]AKF13422.1 hypothetical protein PHIN3_159 [Sinorhizobium phage phiN3]